MAAVVHVERESYEESQESKITEKRGCVLYFMFICWCCGIKDTREGNRKISYVPLFFLTPPLHALSLGATATAPSSPQSEKEKEKKKTQKINMQAGLQDR